MSWPWSDSNIFLQPYIQTSRHTHNHKSALVRVTMKPENLTRYLLHAKYCAKWIRHSPSSLPLVIIQLMSTLYKRWNHCQLFREELKHTEVRFFSIGHTVSKQKYHWASNSLAFGVRATMYPSKCPCSQLDFLLRKERKLRHQGKGNSLDKISEIPERVGCSS
jgi:hypothetical protein